MKESPMNRSISRPTWSMALLSLLLFVGSIISCSGGSSPPTELVSTDIVVGEGFDDARLDTLFLAMPVSWKGTLAQYTGRLHRLRSGKTEVRIYDYVDDEVPMLRRMFEKRLRAYQAIGYARDAQLEDIEPINEPSLEYEEDAFRPPDTAP